jgi:dihydrofolate synthase / folylpolyglutamate synthase
MRTSDELLTELKGLHPRLIDLSLDRIEGLLAKLGHPERRLPPVIHVAGTNGKGSVTAFLRAMLEAASLRVHVYTSPHLVRFHERIALAGPTAGPGGRARPIGERELVDRLTAVQRINARDPITFFEITTAAAFLAFAEAPADAVILEVGLGGRLDATNVVMRPALSVITPISLDHADKLGGTVAEIAREKAGILKTGVSAVVSAQPPEALEVIRARAHEVVAPLSVWGEDFEAFEQNSRMVFQSAERLLDLPLPALIGQHQIANAGTAIAAALRLRWLGLDDASIEQGLRQVRWPARMQRLDDGPLAQLLRPGSELWLDGGHNPAGGQAIAQTLAELEERAPKEVSIVAGMMRNKDAARFLEHFRGLARRIVTVPVPASPEGAFAPDELAAVASSVGLDARPAPDVETALRGLQGADGEAQRILICGSLYLAGHVLALQEGVQAQAN